MVGHGYGHDHDNGNTPQDSTTEAPSNPHMDLDPKYDDYDFPTTAPETQSGHPGHTTKEQDAQVHQLRAMLEQEGYTDRLDTLTLLRFLRARKFNVELSKQMYEFFPFDGIQSRQHRPIGHTIVVDANC